MIAAGTSRLYRHTVMGTIKALPVPEGSIVWINDISFGDDPDVLGHFKTALRDAIGHDRFLVVQTDGGGEIEVVDGPDELVERLRQQLDLAGFDPPTNVREGLARAEAMLADARHAHLEALGRLDGAGDRVRALADPDRPPPATAYERR